MNTHPEDRNRHAGRPRPATLSGRNMKRRIVFLLGVFVMCTLAVDAFATATCKTRSRCRWWSKQYVATTTVRCAWNPIPLCHRRSSSCGNANAYCSWRACINGGATASANNGPGGCSMSGFRTGWGRYGEPASNPDPAGSDGEGGHDLENRVEFLDQEGIMLHLDHMAMSSTVDRSFSRLDVVAYVESKEALANDEDDFPPQRVVWQGYIHLQEGVLTQQGFDEELREYLGREGITELILEGIAKMIRVEVTADEFERLAVDVTIDGGQAEIES